MYEKLNLCEYQIYVFGSASEIETQILYFKKMILKIKKRGKPLNICLFL